MWMAPQSTNILKFREREAGLLNHIILKIPILNLVDQIASGLVYFTLRVFTSSILKYPFYELVKYFLTLLCHLPETQKFDSFIGITFSKRNPTFFVKFRTQKNSAFLMLCLKCTNHCPNKLIFPIRFFPATFLKSWTS